MRRVLGVWLLVFVGGLLIFGGLNLLMRGWDVPPRVSTDADIIRNDMHNGTVCYILTRGGWSMSCVREP